MTSSATSSTSRSQPRQGEPIPEPPAVQEIRTATDRGSALYEQLFAYLDREGDPVMRRPTSPANGLAGGRNTNDQAVARLDLAEVLKSPPDTRNLAPGSLRCQAHRPVPTTVDRAATVAM